jgi:hypothetical protein
MTAILFVALVVVMVLLVFRGLRRAGAGAVVVAGITAAYLVVPADCIRRAWCRFR